MEYQQILEEQFNNVVDQESLSSIMEKAGDVTAGIASNFSAENILAAIADGRSIFDDQAIIEDIRSLFFLEMKSALILCVQILTICIVIGLLKGLSSSFSSKSVSEISMMICSMVMIGICITNFKTTYQLAADSVNTMSNTMEILMPVMIGILISTGSAASGTILSPMITGSITGVSFILKTFVLPALFAATILTLINCLTEKDYVNKLAKLIRNAAVTLTGLLLVILAGIINLQGLLTDASDGLLLSTARYSLSTFIPIVGGFTSDTVELFLRCMSTIKSVVGVFGIIIILILLLTPLIKIMVIALIYKITGALAEPMTDSKISAGLNEMGSCVISIGAIMFFTALLFIMFISTIIKIGGS